MKIGEPAVLLLASVSDDPAWEWTVRPTTPVIMVEPYQSPNSLKKGDPA